MNNFLFFCLSYYYKSYKGGRGMGTLQKICLVLVIIGAINWGLVGLFKLDLVATLFGDSENIIARIIYCLIGICGLINIGILFKDLDEPVHK